MKRPTIFPSSGYDDLVDILPSPGFFKFTERDDLLNAIKGIGGYSSSDNYEGTVAMRSSTSDRPPTIGSVAPAASDPIFMTAAIRRDIHAGGEPHINIDYNLIFKDNSGVSWRMTATDKTDNSGHFLELCQDSGLDILLDVCNLPDASQGTLDDLKNSVIATHPSTGPYVGKDN